MFNMDKFYFITIMAYQSVNKMGLKLGEYVSKRYDQVVVHADCMDDIKADIQKKMRELEMEFPRSRPFELTVTERYDKYKAKYTDIRVSANSATDSHIFIMNISVIRRLNLEVNLNF